MAYGDFKGLARRIASDKVLRDKAFHLILQKILRMMDIKEDWLLWFANVFDKMSKGSGIGLESSEQFAKELHKPIN